MPHARKGPTFAPQFLRLKGRRGPRKAIVAVPASILTAVYFMLKRGVPYADLGPDHFDRTDRTRTASRLVRRLIEMGFEVQIKAAA